MSYQSWHAYGLGIRCEDIKTNLDRLKAMLSLAPKTNFAIRRYLEREGFNSVPGDSGKIPTWDDYMAYDENFDLGLATILAEVMAECEDVRFSAVDDAEGNTYVVYSQSYPWRMSDKEKNLSEHAVWEMIQKYVRMLTDADVAVEYQEIKNGG